MTPDDPERPRTDEYFIVRDPPPRRGCHIIRRSVTGEEEVVLTLHRPVTREEAQGLIAAPQRMRRLSGHP